MSKSLPQYFFRIALFGIIAIPNHANPKEIKKLYGPHVSGGYTYDDTSELISLSVEGDFYKDVSVIRGWKNFLKYEWYDYFIPDFIKKPKQQVHLLYSEKSLNTIYNFKTSCRKEIKKGHDYFAKYNIKGRVAKAYEKSGAWNGLYNEKTYPTYIYVTDIEFIPRSLHQKCIAMGRQINSRRN